MGWSRVAVAVVVAAVVAAAALRLHTVLNFDTQATPVDADHCALVGADVIVGSEDLAHVGGGLFLVSSGDLKNTFAGDPAAPGAIFAVDLAAEPATVRALSYAVPVPAGIPFQPHGIQFSNTTRRLYAVSHGLAAGDGSRVFVFNVGPAPSFDLSYVRSIQSPLFKNGAINDVAEGAGGKDIFVTEWLQVGLPARGSHHAADLLEAAQPLLQLASAIFRPAARVFRCAVSDAGANAAAATAAAADGCTVVADDFYMANGISGNGKGRLFVNELFDRKIRTMELGADGRLHDVAPPIELAIPVDNVEYDAGTNTLHMGTVPQPALSEHFDVPVPGGYAVAHLDTGKTEMRVLMHDGTKLSQISAAYAWNGQVILGSPFGRGVLVCQQKQVAAA